MIRQKIKSFIDDFAHVKNIIILGLLFLFIFSMTYNNTDMFRSEDYLINKKISKYYTTWTEFQRLTGKDIHQIWVEKYYYVVYQLNGNSKENRYDCFSSLFLLLKSYGANLPLQRVEEFFETLKILSKSRVSLKEVKEKDLIIFKMKDGNWHIGIITKIKGDKLYYCDVNVLDGAGYNKIINYGNYAIKGIFPISLKVWMGNILDSYLEPIKTEPININNKIENSIKSK